MVEFNGHGSDDENLIRGGCWGEGQAMELFILVEGRLCMF